MQEVLKRAILICLYVCVSLYHSGAQPKAVGTSWSLSGLAISYEHVLNERCFLDAEVRAETREWFMDSNRLPGASASLVGNFIISDWKSVNGNEVRAFAGPGVTIGMSHDFRKDYGYFFGLKGRAGIECLFDRNVSVSVSLCPVLGLHMILREDYLEMKYFKNGLINSIIPEIGIKYLF